MIATGLGASCSATTADTGIDLLDAWIALAVACADLPVAAVEKGARIRGGEMIGHQCGWSARAEQPLRRSSRAWSMFDNVSRFYGEVLGVNRVTLSIPPGITSLVGPNGSGKTTLMNLMTGLVRPTRGSIRVLGIAPDDPERLFRAARLFDAVRFVSRRASPDFSSFIPSCACSDSITPNARRSAWKAIERVNLVEAAKRKVAGYSKGMRQRIKLAQAIAHDPRVLVLDEPLNGLDPLVRAETIALFRELAAEGPPRDRVEPHSARSRHDFRPGDSADATATWSPKARSRACASEISDQPMQVLIRCNRPAALASKVFRAGSRGGGAAARRRRRVADQDARRRPLLSRC